MSLMQGVVSQFRQPYGFLGQLAGFIMAKRPSNIERNLWTLELLDLQSDDRVLEVGYGPGVAIERAAEKLTNGSIVGVDHSAAMFSQASRRNSEAIESGRVKLLSGSLSELSAYEACFDKIFSANVIQFWPDPMEFFTRLKAVLKPAGKILTRQPYRLRSALVCLLTARHRSAALFILKQAPITQSVSRHTRAFLYIFPIVRCYHKAPARRRLKRLLLVRLLSMEQPGPAP